MGEGTISSARDQISPGRADVLETSLAAAAAPSLDSQPDALSKTPGFSMTQPEISEVSGEAGQSQSLDKMDIVVEGESQQPLDTDKLLISSQTLLDEGSVDMSLDSQVEGPDQIESLRNDLSGSHHPENPGLESKSNLEESANDEAVNQSISLTRETVSQENQMLIVPSSGSIIQELVPTPQIDMNTEGTALNEPSERVPINPDLNNRTIPHTEADNNSQITAASTNDSTRHSVDSERAISDDRVGHSQTAPDIPDSTNQEHSQSNSSRQLPPISTTNSIRYQALVDLSSRCLEESIKYLTLDRVLACYPTIAKRPKAGQAMEQALKQVTNFWRRTAQKEFAAIFQERDIQAKLAELEQLIAEAYERRQLSPELRKPWESPVFLDKLTPQNILASNLRQAKLERISQLKSKILLCQEENSSLKSELTDSQQMLSTLIESMQHCLRDLESTISAVNQLPERKDLIDFLSNITQTI
ncbi:MIND complex subunit NNF1 [Sugiyamaella lignohabitans]|uniref:MIND complex subunit NNF1 n=1 Tax=Sugiyamaella lignohabitans TaxID=796027 RepID=A0A167FKD8_9ASCO|nr:MIND complex subunit NNF1 [Sugiyamaella lignohabitans]ANB15412.1 MIND complex subunit NNF1 [Sugiyamaella lignohabitans]